MFLNVIEGWLNHQLISWSKFNSGDCGGKHMICLVYRLHSVTNIQKTGTSNVHPDDQMHGHCAQNMRKRPEKSWQNGINLQKKTISHFNPFHSYNIMVALQQPRTFGFSGGCIHPTSPTHIGYLFRRPWISKLICSFVACHRRKLQQLSSVTRYDVAYVYPRMMPCNDTN